MKKIRNRGFLEVRSKSTAGYHHAGDDIGTEVQGVQCWGERIPDVGGSNCMRVIVSEEVVATTGAATICRTGMPNVLVVGSQ